MTGGNGVRKVPRLLLTLLRIVRAAYSSFSEVTQTGTMLCASTWHRGTSIGSAFRTSSTHCIGTRSGLKSHTTPPIRCFFTKAGTF
uniref:Putative secreted protein n=1 Tax=Anopheles marajoara TaxID=58244 RepID=A0A2M4CAJ4_9DIPT